jgi:hypothetical protein
VPVRVSIDRRKPDAFKFGIQLPLRRLFEASGAPGEARMSMVPLPHQLNANGDLDDTHRGSDNLFLDDNSLGEQCYSPYQVLSLE